MERHLRPLPTTAKTPEPTLEQKIEAEAARRVKDEVGKFAVGFLIGDLLGSLSHILGQSPAGTDTFLRKPVFRSSDLRFSLVYLVASRGAGRLNSLTHCATFHNLACIKRLMMSR